jgi:hypothetical protein
MPKPCICGAEAVEGTPFRAPRADRTEAMTSKVKTPAWCIAITFADEENKRAK